MAGRERVRVTHSLDPSFKAGSVSNGCSEPRDCVGSYKLGFSLNRVEPTYRLCWYFGTFLF